MDVEYGHAEHVQEEVLVWSVWVLTPQYREGWHYTVKKALSDKTLNRGLDSMWSLNNPWHFL